MAKAVLLRKLIQTVAPFLFLTACFSSIQKSQQINNNENINSVIGGVTSTDHKYDFAVNIWMHSPDYTDHLCGASLVSKKWVLTAAHCVLEDVSEVGLGTVKPSQLTLYIGGHQFSGKDGRVLSVKNILVHPQFKWPNYDVALIQINESVDDISPVLVNQKVISDDQLPQSANAVGWGLIDEEGLKYPELLQQIELPLVSRKICNEDYLVRSRNWTIGLDTICAKTNMGKNATCAGDSGGPLVQFENNQPVQIGVVSWGAACRPAFKLHQSDVEGYADVAAAAAWILKTIQ